MKIKSIKKIDYKITKREYLRNIAQANDQIEIRKLLPAENTRSDEVNSYPPYQ